MKVSVILPTYNEKGNIVLLVHSLLNVFGKAGFRQEIIVVDDNSSDGTAEAVKRDFQSNNSVRVFVRRRGRGLATAIRYGIERSSGNVVVVMDTDFNHEPELVPRLVRKCEKYDIAVGSRFVRGGGMANQTREWLSRLFNIFLVRPIIGSPVHDNLSGFFAMKREELDKLPFDKIFYGYGDYFIRLIYLAKKQGNSFTELPSFYKDREYGVSKSRFFEMFRDYFASALAIRFAKE